MMVVRQPKADGPWRWVLQNLWHKKHYSSRPLQLSLGAHLEKPEWFVGIGESTRRALEAMPNGNKPELNKPQVVGADDFLVDARSTRMWSSIQALATIIQAKVNYEITSYQLVKSPVLLMLLMMLINFTIDESSNPNFTVYTFFDLLGFL